MLQGHCPILLSFGCLSEQSLSRTSAVTVRLVELRLETKKQVHKHAPVPVIPLALPPGSRLDVGAMGEPAMQPRETTPLWVGLTFTLMIVGTVLYLTGYFMIEDLLAFFK
jgi:hypothetical protein